MCAKLKEGERDPHNRCSSPPPPLSLSLAHLTQHNTEEWLSVNVAILQLRPWKNLLQANIPFPRKEKPPLLLLIPLPSSYARSIRSFPTLPSRWKLPLVLPAQLFPITLAAAPLRAIRSAGSLCQWKVFLKNKNKNSTQATSTSGTTRGMPMCPVKYEANGVRLTWIY